jgi:phage terminase large subunit-like protein
MNCGMCSTGADLVRGNVAAQSDAAGNIKPSKALSPQKIDGVVAAVLWPSAASRCAKHRGARSMKARGLLTLSTDERPRV